MAEDIAGEIDKPKRWAIPFASDMTEADVDAILKIPPFSHIDPSAFSPLVPLRGLFLNDCRRQRYQRGDIIMRAGDYGNSAFFIISGSTRLVLDSLDEGLLGRGTTQRKTFWQALSQLWKNPTLPEVQNLEHVQQDHRLGSRKKEGGRAHIFLQDVPHVLDEHRTARVEAGDFIGEVAALGRTERVGTYFAEEDCELLEIRWQGVRELRLRSPEIKAHIDRLYRERSLKRHLEQTPIFKHLSQEDLEKVAAQTQFLSFGTFEWFGSYKRLREKDPADRLAAEPVIAHEDDYPNGIFLIRSGYARLSESYNHGEKTVSYLGKGQVFGYDEICYNWLRGKSIPFGRTLRAVGYVDALFVPTAVVESFVLSKLDRARLSNNLPSPRIKSEASAYRQDAANKLSPNMLEFLVENRVINGTATMIIDLERCTRCDDCVRACASTHNNNPRFIRHGLEMDGFMIANACMHCADPVCMIGCPTGAIHRETAHGQVVINNETCIGCATCANSCPYDNIQMVLPHRPEGGLYYDKTTHLPIQKAAKCDLCHEQLSGPSCVRACPHDAMIRADMRDVDALATWFNK